MAGAVAKELKTIEELFYNLPPPKQRRPDMGYVRKRKDQLAMLWGEAHAHWDVVDAFVNDENPLWVEMPELVRKARGPGIKRSGRARQLLDTAASVFLASDPKVRREPVGEGKTHDAKADVVEDFGAAWLKDVDRKEMEAPSQTIKKHLLLYNYAVMEAVTLETNAQERLPEAVENSRPKRLFNPTRIGAPHPRSVLMDPRQAIAKEAVVLLRMTRGQLEDISLEYGSQYLAGDDRYLDVEAWEYWSEDWHQLYEADNGKAIVDERNPHLSVPFAHRFGPLGMVTGDTQDSRWLRRKCVGILEPVLDLLTQYDEISSAEQHYLQKAAYLKLRVDNKDVAEAAEEATGNLVTGGKDDWGYIVTPDLPATLARIKEDIDRRIEENTFPKHLGGFRPEGVTTVGQNAQLNVAASRKFQPFLRVMEDLMSIALARAFRLIITWNHAVTVDGITLKPEDLEGDDNVRVSYPYFDALLELEKRQDAYLRKDKGLLDFDGVQEAIGVENPTKIRKGIYRDLLMQHPALIERGVRQVAEEDGLADIIDEWTRKQRAGALVGPRGEPISSGQGGGGETPQRRQPVDIATAKPPQQGMAQAAAMTGGA